MPKKKKQNNELDLEKLIDMASKDNLTKEEKENLDKQMAGFFDIFGGGCPECEEKIKFVKTHEDAKLPEYKTESSSGFDFYTPIDFTIKAKDSYVVDTGLKVAEIPEGFELQIRSRSGLAAKDKIFVLNTPGTIDNDYRGNIMIILFNLSDKDKEFHKGDRIAQGVFSTFFQFKAEFVEEKDVKETKRGEGGLGSTGA